MFGIIINLCEKNYKMLLLIYSLMYLIAQRNGCGPQVLEQFDKELKLIDNWK